jgi:hypothetical protein
MTAGAALYGVLAAGMSLYALVVVFKRRVLAVIKPLGPMYVGLLDLT